MLALDVSLEASLFTKRGHNQVMDRILHETLDYHAKNRLHRHFERNQDTAPGGGYGYAARTRKYQIKKARMVGHQIPLVLTGRLKQHILGNVKITGNSKRATLRTRGYFPMKKNELRREIETFSREEILHLRASVGLRYVTYAQRPEYQDIRRKRSRKG